MTNEERESNRLYPSFCKKVADLAGPNSHDSLILERIISLRDFYLERRNQGVPFRSQINCFETILIRMIASPCHFEDRRHSVGILGTTVVALKVEPNPMSTKAPSLLSDAMIYEGQTQLP